jgi:hypothetical protein
MPPARRIGKRELAFKWSALAFTCVATAVALWELLKARNAAQVVSAPIHLLPVSQSALPHTVSHATVGLSLLALGLMVIVQLVVLVFTRPGRHHAAITIVTEMALWIGFALASYAMQRGYQAAVTCTGPPTHCSVMYPSILPALLAGAIVGMVIGGAWALVCRSERRPTEQTEAHPIATGAT